MRQRTLRTAVLAALGAFPLLAAATNGYFPHGYGMKNKAMAGASIGQAHDAFGGANNPASMAFAGNRFDVELDWFNPVRAAERSGAGFPTLNGRVESDKEHFFIPGLGYVQSLNPQWTFGVTVYGNGGMNTDYPGGGFNCGAGAANILCGNGRLGVDLMQLIVAPTVAWKFHPDHAVGLAPLFGYQRFKMQGLQAFDSPLFSSSPGSVTNRGYDSSTGFGARLGYFGRAGIATFGAAYAPRMRMSAFDKYKGLFAEGGDFDIPSHYGLGIAVQATPALTIAFDYVRINYGEIKSVGNPSTVPAQLGSANGPGFGWQDIDVFKLGVAWKLSGAFTLRAGYNRGDNPIQSRDVTFNILAPGVMKDHYTVGFTYALSPTSELNMAYMRAPKQSVSGPSILPSGGTERIEMHQNQLGISFGMRF
ncbi:MAG: porin [Burkholderiaceae bacterium]|nr:porin [Burkholderiaceae bacterium]